MNNFSLITYEKLNLLNDKNCGNATSINFLSFVTDISIIFLFLLQTTYGHFFCFCVYFYLFGRYKSLKVSSDWIQHQNLNQHFVMGNDNM